MNLEEVKKYIFKINNFNEYEDFIKYINSIGLDIKSDCKFDIFSFNNYYNGMVDSLNSNKYNIYWFDKRINKYNWLGYSELNIDFLDENLKLIEWKVFNRKIKLKKISK